MADRPREERPFLPPEPPGPEPELGRRPAPPGWQPPPPGWQPPPGGWQPAPGGWQPAPRPWGHPPAPEPDNGPAVAGFVLSVVAAGLLLVSAGTSSIISVACAALGIWYGLRGRRRVDAGETRKHGGLAQAGFVTGIVALVLSVLATLFWALMLVLALTDEAFRDDLERELEQREGTSAALRLGAAALRAAAPLVS